MNLKGVYQLGQTTAFSFVAGGLFWTTINLISWARYVMEKGEINSDGIIAFSLIILFGSLGAELNVTWSNVRGTHEPLVQIAILIGCFVYYALTWTTRVESDSIVMSWFVLAQLVIFAFIWATSMTSIRVIAAAILYHLKRRK